MEEQHARKQNARGLIQSIFGSRVAVGILLNTWAFMHENGNILSKQYLNDLFDVFFCIATCPLQLAIELGTETKAAPALSPHYHTSMLQRPLAMSTEFASKGASWDNLRDDVVDDDAFTRKFVKRRNSAQCSALPRIRSSPGSSPPGPPFPSRRTSLTNSCSSLTNPAASSTNTPAVVIGRVSLFANSELSLSVSSLSKQSMVHLLAMCCERNENFGTVETDLVSNRAHYKQFRFGAELEQQLDRVAVLDQMIYLIICKEIRQFETIKGVLLSVLCSFEHKHADFIKASYERLEQTTIEMQLLAMACDSAIATPAATSPLAVGYGGPSSSSPSSNKRKIGETPLRSSVTIEEMPGMDVVVVDTRADITKQQLPRVY